MCGFAHFCVVPAVSLSAGSLSWAYFSVVTKVHMGLWCQRVVISAALWERRRGAAWPQLSLRLRPRWAAERIMSQQNHSYSGHSPGGRGGVVGVQLTHTLLETTTLIGDFSSLPHFLPRRGQKNSIYFTTNHNRSCSKCGRAIVSHTCENGQNPVTHVSVRRQRVVGVEEDGRLWAKFPDHRNKSLLFCSGGTLRVCFHHDRDGTCVKCVCVAALRCFSSYVCLCVRGLSV